MDTKILIHIFENFVIFYGISFEGVGTHDLVYTGKTCA